MPPLFYRLITIITLSTIMVVCSIAGAVGQIHYSARIYALGGSAVSGVVPDYYTDLMLNPAYAALSDAITINYGHRESPQYLFPFLHLEQDFSLMRPETNQYDTNELLVHGIGMWGWKVSLISEWYALTSDDTGSNMYTNYSGLDYTDNLYATRRNEDSRYLHAAVSFSRFVGDTRILGLRIGTFDNYWRYTYQSTTCWERFRFSENLEQTYLYQDERRYSYTEKKERWLSPYMQIGLLCDRRNGRSSEIVFKVSQGDVNVRFESFNLGITNRYGATSPEKISHDYNRSDWIDNKDGALWSFDLSGGHTFADGFRIYAGGGYRTARYDGDWVDVRRDYNWSGLISDMNLYQSVTGTGDFTEYSFFGKAGKTFRLERRIDITAGVAGSLTRSLNQEEPMALYTKKIEHDDTLESRSASSCCRFEMEHVRAQLLIPLAVEFRPAGYFAVFAGFTSRVGWTRNTEKYRIPPIFERTMQRSSPALRTDGAERALLGDTFDTFTAENSEDVIYSDYTATVGFSLNYKNRLVFDCYSGSDITPDSMQYLILDLRYRF